MTTLTRIVVGFLVSLPIMCLLAGGVEQAFMILLVSIVCTAGIGLAVWIPTWWAVGWITLTLVSANRGRADEDATGGRTPESTPKEVTSEEASLLQFLKHARARGIDDTRIEEALAGAGWSKTEIQAARQFLQSTAAEA